MAHSLGDPTTEVVTPFTDRMPMAERGKRTSYPTLGAALTARGCGSADRVTITRVVEIISDHSGTPRRFVLTGPNAVVDVIFGDDSTVGLFVHRTHLDVASDALSAVGGIAGMAELFPGFVSASGDRSGKVARLELTGHRVSAPRASAPRPSAAAPVRKAVCCDLSQSVGHRCFVCDETVQPT